MHTTADTVICGAGICGLSAAFHLAVREGVKKVVLVDEREPMSFTSDKSTECYRNWWPGPGDTMVRFMNRSIDLLENLARESNNFFGLNRRGYVFLTGNPERARTYRLNAREICEMGAGPLRIHPRNGQHSDYVPSPADGYQGLPAGADLVLDPDIIRKTFPFITNQALAMLHTRRCGWLSAQQLGMYLASQAKKLGVELIHGSVVGIKKENNRIQGVIIQTTKGSLEISTDNFVIASGPFLKQTGKLIGVDLPVENELHGKAAFKDPLGLVPRDAPLMIWDDPVHLFWTEKERQELAQSEETRWLLEQFPSGVHFRPEGGAGSPILLGVWTYDTHIQEPVEKPLFDPEYAEIILRGLVNLVPALSRYAARMIRPVIDGGYYCKTRENRPLIGPLPVKGAFVFGAVSGFGIMSSMAGGELLAKHIVGGDLPVYSDAFLLSRYHDPEYVSMISKMANTSGQL